jgi:hypothetical protein
VAWHTACWSSSLWLSYSQSAYTPEQIDMLVVAYDCTHSQSHEQQLPQSCANSPCGCASEGAGDFGSLQIPLVTWNMVTWLQWARTGKLAKSCSIMHVPAGGSCGR